MRKYFKLMRVHHYIKNVLIFFPLFFNGSLFNINLFFDTITGFLSFCFTSSIIYIINDIQDVDKDRLHTKKKNRAIASGEISIKLAWIIACMLAVLSILFNCISSGTNVLSWSILVGYVVINFAYSIKLKDIPILDITILVLGFLLRLYYGSVITNIEISKWLFLIVMSISFYLGIGKRRNELKFEGINARKVLKYYNYKLLNKIMYACLLLTIVFYFLWSLDAPTMIHLGRGNIVWTTPLVLAISTKYSLNIEGISDGDPVNVIYHDKVLILMVVVYIITIFLIIYKTI